MPRSGFVANMPDNDQDDHLERSSTNRQGSPSARLDEVLDHAERDRSQTVDNDDTRSTASREPGLAASRHANAPSSPTSTWQRLQRSSSRGGSQRSASPGVGPSSSARRGNRRSRPHNRSSASQHHGNQGQGQAQGQGKGKRLRDDSPEPDDMPPAKKPGGFGGLASFASMGTFLNASHGLNLNKGLKVSKTDTGVPQAPTMKGPKPPCVASTYGNGTIMDTDWSNSSLEQIKQATELARKSSPIGRALHIIVPFRPLFPHKHSTWQWLHSSGEEPEMLFAKPPPDPAMVLAIQQPGSCQLCGSMRHKTGRCPWSQNGQGDVATCPWHDKTAADSPTPHVIDAITMRAEDGQETGCREFSSLNIAIEADLEMLIKVLIVDRQKEAPLRMRRPLFCFVRLGIYYAERYHGGQMPPKINFNWPYLKHEAVRFSRQLKELAQGQRTKDNMPRGCLQGRSIDEIKEMLFQGDIPRQIHNRTLTAIRAHQMSEPESRTFLDRDYYRLEDQPTDRDPCPDDAFTVDSTLQYDGDSNGDGNGDGAGDGGKCMDIDPSQPQPESSKESGDSVTVGNPSDIGPGHYAVRAMPYVNDIATRANIPPEIWNAMLRCRDRGELDNFLREVMDDIECYRIGTPACDLDILFASLAENCHHRFIREAMVEVGWLRAT